MKKAHWFQLTGYANTAW